MVVENKKLNAQADYPIAHPNEPVRHGQGKLTFVHYPYFENTGDVYVGSFEHGRISGEGTLTQSHGFQKDGHDYARMDGFTNANGAQYKGVWRWEEPEQNDGVLHDENPDQEDLTLHQLVCQHEYLRYQLNFRANGSVIYPATGDRYEGEFRYGKVRTGRYEVDADRNRTDKMYFVEVITAMKDGYGKCTLAHKSEEETQARNNADTSEEFYAAGVTLEGTFKDGRENGTMIYTNPDNGDSVHGEWNTAAGMGAAYVPSEKSIESMNATMYRDSMHGETRDRVYDSSALVPAKTSRFSEKFAESVQKMWVQQKIAQQWTDAWTAGQNTDPVESIFFTLPLDKVGDGPQVAGDKVPQPLHYNVVLLHSFDENDDAMRYSTAGVGYVKQILTPLAEELVTGVAFGAAEEFVSSNHQLISGVTFRDGSGDRFTHLQVEIVFVRHGFNGIDKQTEGSQLHHAISKGMKSPKIDQLHLHGHGQCNSAMCKRVDTFDLKNISTDLVEPLLKKKLGSVIKTQVNKGGVIKAQKKWGRVEKVGKDHVAVERVPPSILFINCLVGNTSQLKKDDENVLSTLSLAWGKLSDLEISVVGTHIPVAMADTFGSVTRPRIHLHRLYKKSQLFADLTRAITVNGTRTRAITPERSLLHHLTRDSTFENGVFKASGEKGTRMRYYTCEDHTSKGFPAPLRKPISNEGLHGIFRPDERPCDIFYNAKKSNDEQPIFTCILGDDTVNKKGKLFECEVVQA